MDLQMPVIDGYKVAQKIRTFDKQTPIIVLTATTLLKADQDVISLGMNDYMTKPFDPKKLKRKIAHYLKD